LLPAGLVLGGGCLAWHAARRPPLRRALAGAALVGLALWAAGSVALQRSGAGPGPSVPDLPLFALADGGPSSLPRLMAGQPVVLNLWASWCGPCRAEMPLLAAAQQRERGIRFLFVNQGESAAVVRAYLQREGLALEGVWLDAGRRAGPALGSQGLPTTLFFDSRGRQVDAHFGVLNATSLQLRLLALKSP
jgi:thiol-disulfide isomerase/thioredoxin